MSFYNTVDSWPDQWEALTQKEMNVHVDNGTFRLGLVWMSNIGKSKKGQAIDELDNFTHYEVDAAIMTELWFSSMDEMAKAMADGSLTETQYLKLEGKHTHNPQVERGEDNLVFDTTGSVIDLNEEVQHWLRESCLLVHLQLNEEKIPEMVERYVETPKPVIWWDIQKSTWDDDRAMQYRKLLKDRLDSYERLAHISIPVQELWDATGDEILQIIWKKIS